MIIHEPEITKHEGSSIISAKIELMENRYRFPEYLWYRVPERYSKYISTQSDAFLAPALIAAMHYREDIHVRGTVSPRLAYALDEYQFLLELRLSEYLRRVKIHYTKRIASDANPKGIATTFSGGVDGFFTIKTHLPESQPIQEYQITHALFIQGFDISLKNQSAYKTLFLRYKNVLADLGIELVPIETNSVNLILPELNLNLFYGPVLAGCGMILDKLFRRFYIASSRDYHQLAIRASSSGPLTDRLLSTETLDIVHIGADHRRIEKIEKLKNWKIVQNHLRVCTLVKPENEHLNCSRCEKCTRTMFTLYAMGKMKEFKTFSKPFKIHRDILWLARKYDPQKDNYAPEAFLIAKKYNPTTLSWLYLAAFLGTIRHNILKLLPVWIKKWLRRYGYFLDPNGENALDNPAILSLIRSSSADRGNFTL